jgi:hypothetical protein
VVKTTGDGFHAAFATASDAVDAAIDAQIGLVAEPWPDTGPVRVRMGVHTGAAEVRGGDYYGTSLNRAARLMSVGHGGQVLVSLATNELVRDSGVELEDLGSHHLRDLGEPERIFQVVHPQLDTDFAPLRSLDAFATSLPLQVTTFVGRDDDLADVIEALGQISGWRARHHRSPTRPILPRARHRDLRCHRLGGPSPGGAGLARADGRQRRGPTMAAEYRRGLDLADEGGDTGTLLLNLDVYVQALATTDRVESAAVLAAALVALSPHVANPISIDHRQQTNEQLVAQLGEERVAELTAQGATLGYEATVALARAELDRVIAQRGVDA